MSLLKEAFKHEYDAIVCGSGPAGGVVAVQLAKSGMRTLVLEASDGGSGALNDIATNVQVYGQPSPQHNFARKLGGSSNLWSGRISSFEDVDFSLNKWPLEYRDYLEDIPKAQNILGISPIDSESQEKKLSLGPLGELSQPPFSLKAFVMQHHFEPFNAGKYLIDNQCDELTIVEGVFVRKVFEDGDGAICGLEVRCLNTNDIFVLKAKNYVIATGGLDVPRVLLESDLPSLVDNEALGKFVSTHPKMVVGVLKLKHRIRADNGLLSDMLVDGQYIRFGLGLDGDFIKTNSLLNHYLQVAPVFESFSLNMLEILRDRSIFVNYLYGLGPWWSKSLEMLGRVIFSISQRIAGKFGYYSVFQLKLHCDQFPSENNKVSMSNVKNHNGDAKVDIKWTFSSRDLGNARRFLLSIKERIECRGVGIVDLDEKVYTENWPLIGMHSHLMGATRMGDDPNKSVTDSYGKVHGTKNLYIAGPSLFASYGYTNPVLPIVTFALRTAKEIINNPTSC